ncbi:putative NBD/HSP70 family sugar kinase [Catenulispora sp. EB89]|uniref:ROK family transcriptional regulator n=1 Tax=Catenulispora sp. EB89 TaxID=3156257 RepID=UPI003518EBE9
MTSRAQRTTRDLRWHNRSDVLTRLYLRECTNRNDLARASGLSAATISNVVSDLIADGLVGENGSQSSAGGRPRSLLRVRPDFGHVVGVDIGETEIRVGLFDWTLQPVADDEVRAVATAQIPPHEVADQILSEIAAVTARAGITPDGLLGVGIGVPGAGGSVIHAPTLGWSAVPLAGLLRAGLGFAPDVDNGAMALGQAENWRGAARGAERAVTLLLGIGAGGALSMTAGPAGRARSFTMEWGHTVVDLDGPMCRCGARGCLETYIGAEAILARYAAMPGSAPFDGGGGDGAGVGSGGGGGVGGGGGDGGGGGGAGVGGVGAGGGGGVGGVGAGGGGGGGGVEAHLAELVARAVKHQEPAASAVLDETARYLGVGISNLINLVAPDRVILSGWAGALLCDALLPAVRLVVRQHALPYLQEFTRIEPGELGPSATALGAATLPVARLLADGGRRGDE